MTVLTPTALAVTYPSGCPTSGKACFRSVSYALANTSSSDWDTSTDYYASGEGLWVTPSWKNSMNTYYARIQINNGTWTCRAPSGPTATWIATNIVGAGLTGISVSLTAC